MLHFKIVHDDIPIYEMPFDDYDALIEFVVRERTRYQKLVKVLNSEYPLTSNCIRHRLHQIEHQLNNIHLILTKHYHFEYETENKRFR